MSDGVKEYPYASGDFVVIGPECFTNGEETVISWKGANYYKACDHKVTDHADGGSSHCVKRVDHTRPLEHEDYDGHIYHEIHGGEIRAIEIPIPALGITEDGDPIQVNKLDIRKAWDAFVKPTQDAKEEMSEETRIIAAVLRTINEALPPVLVQPEEEEG